MVSAQVMIDCDVVGDSGTTRFQSQHRGQLMRIPWYGHAAFLVETEGLRIIMDPFRSPDSGGYEPINEPADVVVVSHENDRYHSHLGQIVPPFEVVRGLELPEGGRLVRGLRFE